MSTGTEKNPLCAIWQKKQFGGEGIYYCTKPFAIHSVPTWATSFWN